jgi:hypothetical protein
VGVEVFTCVDVFIGVVKGELIITVFVGLGCAVTNGVLVKDPATACIVAVNVAL